MYAHYQVFVADLSLSRLGIAGCLLLSFKCSEVASFGLVCTRDIHCAYVYTGTGRNFTGFHIECKKVKRMQIYFLRGWQPSKEVWPAMQIILPGSNSFPTLHVSPIYSLSVNILHLVVHVRWDKRFKEFTFQLPFLYHAIFHSWINNSSYRGERKLHVRMLLQIPHYKTMS